MEAVPSGWTLGGKQRFGAGRAAAGRGLEPRSVGRLLDAAFDVLTARFVVCVGAAVAIWLPVRLGFQLLALDPGDLSATLVWTMLTGVATQLTIALVCRVVSAHLQGEWVGAGSAMWDVLPRLPGVLVLAVISGVLTGVGYVLCLAPGILAAWLFSVAPMALVLERTGVFGAMGRSARLVRGWGGFGRWCGWTVVSFAIILPLQSLPSLLDNVAGRGAIQSAIGLDGPGFSILAATVSAVLLGIGTAFQAIGLTVYYMDCRARREGVDLLLRLSPRDGEGGSET